MYNEEVLIVLITMVAGLLSASMSVFMTLLIKRKNRAYNERSVLAIKEFDEANSANLRIAERYSRLLDQEANQQGKIKLLMKQMQEYLQNSKEQAQKYDNKIEEFIKNHHQQALFQSKIQFWFSLIVSVVGFVFIIIMILITKEANWYEYIVRVVPGAVMEAVSVLFFSQSKATRERASDFLNRLRQDRQLEKAIKIAETIEDKTLQSTLKAEIALHLCGINDINIFQVDKENYKKEVTLQNND